jgi:hypothetical protein
MRSLGLALLWIACTPGSGDAPAGAPIRLPGAAAVYTATPGPAAVSTAAPSVAGSAQERASVRLTQSVLPRRAVPSPGLVAAAHDAEIAVLAASEDGSVAVSADRRGGMRLWPSLDGKREPVVVDDEIAAEQLAIARDGDEIVVAAAGPLGDLAVIRTAASGEPISRTRVDLERTIVALHVISSGFVGLRDDQTVVGVDLRGGRLGTLQAGAGERIAELASRRGRALAFVTGDGLVRARWIEVSEQLAWGTESPPLPIDPVHAVLAPDHQRVAALARDRETLVTVSLRDGRVRGRPLTRNFVLFPVRPLGFLDDRSVALLSAQDEHGWWRGGEWQSIDMTGSDGPAAVTDRRLVTASVGAGANLRLDSLDGTKYLGFRLLDVHSMRRRGDGWMISDGRSVLGIDDRLVARKRYELGIKDARSDDVVLLDARHWVVAVTSQAYLIDVTQPDQRVLLAPSVGRIQYEPTTRLMAIGGGEGQWIGRYDSKAGEFRERIEVRQPDWIELLDPAANQGNVARKIVVDGLRARLRQASMPGAARALTATITAIRDIDFKANEPLREGRSFQRELPYHLTSDLFERTLRSPQPDEIAARIAAQLPEVTRHRTSPDGARIAIVGASRIALRDRDGVARWAAAFPGAVDVLWNGSGELIAFGSGMARIDIATGATLDRRCGWEFGLWGDHEVNCEFGARLCDTP